jgi:hypothetical protein
MAVINHALTLVHDQNGVIVVQWFLDSDLPGKHAFMAPVLRGHFASLCLSKHASSVVAKLIHPSADLSARDLVIDELTSFSSMPALLAEPISAAIILRCLATARPDQKIRMADIIEPNLAKLMPQGLPHLQKIFEEVQAAHSMIQLEDTQHFDGLERVFNIGPTLRSHAVGGPVSNPAIIKQSGRPVILDPPSPFMARSFSFGTVGPISMPDSPEPIVKVDEDRLSFGPSLLQRLENTGVGSAAVGSAIAGNVIAGNVIAGNAIAESVIAESVVMGNSHIGNGSSRVDSQFARSSKPS